MHSSESALLSSGIGLWGFAPPSCRLGRCEADMLYAAQEVSVYVPRYEAEGLFSVSSVDNTAGSDLMGVVCMRWP